MPSLEFTYKDSNVLATVKHVFYAETTRQGVFPHPSHHWFVSASHGEEELAKTLEASETAFHAVKEALDKGHSIFERANCGTGGRRRMTCEDMAHILINLGK